MLGYILLTFAFESKTGQANTSFLNTKLQEYFQMFSLIQDKFLQTESWALSVRIFWWQLRSKFWQNAECRQIKITRILLNNMSIHALAYSDPAISCNITFLKQGCWCIGTPSRRLVAMKIRQEQNKLFAFKTCRSQYTKMYLCNPTVFTRLSWAELKRAVAQQAAWMCYRLHMRTLIRISQSIDCFLVDDYWTWASSIWEDLCKPVADESKQSKMEAELFSPATAKNSKVQLQIVNEIKSFLY